MSAQQAPDDVMADLRNATAQEKAAAFEWLRGQACDGEGIRHAAVLMVEIEELHAAINNASRAVDAAMGVALRQAIDTPETVQQAARYRHWRELWLRDDDLEAMNALGGNQGYSTPEQWDAILDDSMARKDSMERKG